MRISKKFVGTSRIGKRFFRKYEGFDAEQRRELAIGHLQVLLMMRSLGLKDDDLPVCALSGASEPLGQPRVGAPGRR